jgi:CBS-domain-containing membrane protein
MKTIPPRTPLETPLYRLIATLTQFQLGSVLRRARNPRLIVILFVFTAGAIALGIISGMAYLTRLPLLFPPLGPSAFILFHTPMSATASPRNVILSHLSALAVGLVTLSVATAIFPQANLSDPSVMTWPKVIAIASAMGATGLLMVTLRYPHPPAAATALLAVMGFLQNPMQIVGLAAAVLLLVAEAFVFNRLVGGLRYPVWRADPMVIRSSGPLAGIPQAGSSYWQQLQGELLRERSRPDAAGRDARPQRRAG